MHYTSLLAAVAVLGLGANAAPAPPQTCSYAFSQTAPQRVKCEGTLATFKKSSPAEAARIAAVPASSVIDCATACKDNAYCRSFGYTEDTQTCTMYSRNYGGLLLQPDSTSNIAYYSADCFVKNCIRTPANTTTSSIAPCTATETEFTTITQFTETASATLTAVDYTTLDAAVSTTTATNYIVQNVTAFDIVTIIRSVYSTFTLPETTIVTSTSTEVRTTEVTSTTSTTYTSTSSLYYPLAANNARVKPTAVCASPVATVITRATQTNLAATTEATTTTITITSTPEVITSTFTQNITTDVPIETQTAYFNTTTQITRTETVTTTLYAIPVTTTYATSSVLETASTTTTAYTNAPTPTCPASDGKIWSTQTEAFGTNAAISSSWQIGCGQGYGSADLIRGGETTNTFYDCVQGCAEDRADAIAARKMKRGTSVMYCQGAQWDSATNACQWASYVNSNITDATTTGFSLAVLTNQIR